MNAWQNHVSGLRHQDCWWRWSIDWLWHKVLHEVVCNKKTRSQWIHIELFCWRCSGRTMCIRKQRSTSSRVTRFLHIKQKHSYLRMSLVKWRNWPMTSILANVTLSTQTHFSDGHRDRPTDRPPANCRHRPDGPYYAKKCLGRDRCLVPCLVSSRILGHHSVLGLPGSNPNSSIIIIA